MNKRVLVAIDGSETSVLALDEALQIARDAGADAARLYHRSTVDGL